jgi:hypothetical protein
MEQAEAAKPGSQNSVDMDTRRTYIGVCQAAERLANNLPSLVEPLLTKYVEAVEGYGLVLPSALCRGITALKARDALRVWAGVADGAGGKDAAGGTGAAGGPGSTSLDAWWEISRPWLRTGDGEEMMPWTVSQPRYAHLPPGTGAADIEDWVTHWAACFANETLNLLVKDDTSPARLGRLREVAYLFLDRRAEEWQQASRWRRQADQAVLLAIENFTSMFRGCVALISPVPLDRQAKYETCWVAVRRVCHPLG